MCQKKAIKITTPDAIAVNGMIYNQLSGKVIEIEKPANKQPFISLEMATLFVNSGFAEWCDIQANHAENESQIKEANQTTQETLKQPKKSKNNNGENI